MYQMAEPKFFNAFFQGYVHAALFTTRYDSSDGASDEVFADLNITDADGLTKGLADAMRKDCESFLALCADWIGYDSTGKMNDAGSAFWLRREGSGGRFADDTQFEDHAAELDAVAGAFGAFSDYIYLPGGRKKAACTHSPDWMRDACAKSLKGGAIVYGRIRAGVAVEKLPQDTWALGLRRESDAFSK